MVVIVALTCPGSAVFFAVVDATLRCPRSVVCMTVDGRILEMISAVCMSEFGGLRKHAETEHALKC